MTALAQSIVSRIGSLDMDKLLDVVQFIDFLEFRERLEDAEDLRCVEERENEPSFSAREVREALKL